MTPEELHLRDEVLQVLFWLRGEGLGREASLEALSQWIGSPAEELSGVVREMRRDRFVETGADPRSYRLTDLGVREGGRRFVDNFSDTGLGLRLSEHNNCDCADFDG